MSDIMNNNVNISKIRHTVAVMSGKGGVGTSLVTGLLAIALRRYRLQVGVLDGNITCPSIASVFGVNDEEPSFTVEGINAPVSEGGIKIMSMNTASESEGEPLVWRGPMVSSAFKQFYSEVVWGELDYLLIDVPAGTADVPMTVLQTLPLDGVIIVSTPQVIATSVAKKCILMVEQLAGHIIGVVENMASFTEPGGEHCEIFGANNVRSMAESTGYPLLGQLPIDPHLAGLANSGRIEAYESKAYTMLTTHFLTALASRSQAV